MQVSRLFVLFLFSPFLLQCSVENRNEDQTAQERLRRFYSTTEGFDVMNEPLPKFSVKTKKQVHPNQFLKLESPSNSNSMLVQQAQMKGTEAFQKAYCQNVLAKHFPGIGCEETNNPFRSEVESDDKASDLTETWVDDFKSDLDSIPSEGESTIKMWSDDYWKIRYGATSYRYAAGEYFPNYRTAVNSYEQPSEWNKLYNELNFTELAKAVLDWSPSEKYDLTVGEEKFGLTREQKEEGARMTGPDGDVENWMGICHGWAAAALMVPAPTKVVKVTGAQGVKVNWFPHDIRAMASLAWANGSARSNFIGGRCNTKNAETYPNGRLKQQQCFDNNPAAFHLALGNQIGIAKAGFVMDSAFDYEVWNQPVYSYEFTYFNPLNPDKQSKNYQEVMVAYNDAFKKQDRFQNPPTRGSRVKNIVGVMAKVSYVMEAEPSHTPKARETRLVHVTYEYDLELSEESGAIVPSGGEWHTNFHPDFLWVPKKNQVAHMDYDKVELDFTGKEMPEDKISKVAQKASRQGYPLCQVLSVLVNESSGENYACEF